MQNKTASDLRQNELQVDLSDEMIALNVCLKKTTQALGLIREIQGQTKDIVKGYEFIGGVDPQSEIDDMLENLAELLRSRTDGRPQPFSVYDDDDLVLKYSDSKEEKLNRERDLRMWTEVGPLNKKYPNETAAYIGGHQFKLPELIQLRDWMSSVIEWHKKGEQK